MSRKVCVVTGSRAEYGLLRRLLRAIQSDSELTLQIIATGSHLSPEFGSTYTQIEKDNFRADRSIEMLVSSDTRVGMVKSIGLGMIGFADALNELQPDLVVLLGDRFEILASALAAATLDIPIAHVHGGEVTSGAIDDSFRHSITKLAHFHYVAAESYRKRVIQLGEHPSRVKVVGGLGIDNISDQVQFSRTELESSLGVVFRERNLLITYHPVTHHLSNTEQEITELLIALDELKNTTLIFTYPNADPQGRLVVELIKRYVDKNSHAYLVSSLGSERYLSCVLHCDGVIGNSSSGLLEAPSLRRGTINIGTRQEGRLQAKSVINCEANRSSIDKAIKKLYTPRFKHLLENTVNPYGTGGAYLKILKDIKEIDLKGVTKKIFFDVNPVNDNFGSKND